MDYVMEDNLLTKNKSNDRMARVVNVRSYAENELAEAIAGRNMGISKPEALAMLEAAAEIQLEWLKAGNAINLRLAHFHPSIPGNYEEGEYPKEAAIRITPSKEVMEIAKKIPLRQVEAVYPMRIDFVNDVKTGTTNDQVTSGGTVKISGHHLKVAGDDPTVGLAFVNAEYPENVYPVPLTDMIVNNPSELIIVAPEMPSGAKVKVRVTTQYSSGAKVLKKPRSVTSDKTLTVA